MKIIIESIIAICVIIATSCTPDQYRLNESAEYPIAGLIMSDLDSVMKLKGNEIMLYPGGLTALRSEGMTQLHADISTQIISGEGITMYFRTVSDKMEQKNYIRFNYSTNGCKVFENKDLLVSVDSIKAKIGQLARVQIRNDGVIYTITVDCDTVIRYRTNLPATEYLILSSMKNSKIKISGINFDEEYLFGKMKD